MIKLSDYVAKRLREHGISHFFMVSGGGAMHLNDSLGRELSYTACHHEQACAIAAEGYARVNQKPGVVNVTTGPGGLNCMNGLFGQWTDSVPVLYISGQVKRRTMLDNCEVSTRQLGDQEVDIIRTVKHLTKYAVCVKEPKEIKYHLDKAIYECQTGRKGPCWIDIPIDVQASLIDENELVEYSPENNSTNEKSEADSIIKKLLAAKKPLIIAGHGIRLSGAIKEFNDFVNTVKIPVVTTFNGFDLMETNNPYYIGRIGTIGQRTGNFVLQNADLILCLGTRNNIRQVSYNWENFAKNAYKIVADIDNAELKKPLVVPDLAVCSDLKELLPDLLKQANTSNLPDFKEWLDFCINLKSRYCFENHPETVQNDIIDPYHFTYALTKCMKENDIMIMANGSACVCPFQNAIVKHNQRYILNSGDASMGYALPAAIGACYEANGRSVICLEGDGSIMMNIQELQTIKHYNLPIKLFIIKNNGYSSIRQTQRNFFDGRMTGSGVESGVSVPNFSAIGNAFGIKSLTINNPKTLENDIKNILNMKDSVICEVETVQEYSFLPKLSSRVLEDGSMVSATLEDMYPFLDREEFAENFYK